MATLLTLAIVPRAWSSDATVIRAGKLVDTNAGRVLTNQLILVEGGKISAVGASVPAPANATIIDLSDKTVLPGLIDCHTHLTLSAEEKDPIQELQSTAAQSAFASIPNAKAKLLSGFTTVRDLGPYRALVDVALRDAIERGDVTGPRMYVAGAFITITGGAGAITGLSPDVTLPWDLHFGEVNSPAEVRQRIRALVSARVDVIKVLTTGAVMAHNSNTSASEFTLDELRAAVDEAAQHNLRVAAHAHSPAGIKNAVMAGVASIEHGSMLDDETVALMKQRGTYLVPTLSVLDCLGDTSGRPADFIEHARRIAAIYRDSFQKALRAGVKIALGSDSVVCPHDKGARELHYMVAYGMAPMRALLAATIAGADLIGVTDAGAIQPGKRADIIAVRGDPIEDVRALESVEFVMKSGIVYKR